MKQILSRTPTSHPREGLLHHPEKRLALSDASRKFQSGRMGDSDGRSERE